MNLFSSGRSEERTQHGMLPKNRRARGLKLESLEHRQLLSVSPGMAPDEACDLGQYLAQANEYVEPVALVSTMDPTAATDAALPEAAPEAAAADAGVTLVDDYFAMASNLQLGAGVLANDTGVDGEGLFVSLESAASHGELNLGIDGLFTYRPDIEFGGIDSFTYSVSDGVNTLGTATVTIEVTSVENAGPEAAEDAYSLTEDGTLTVGRDDGVLANDTDAEGDPLYANLVSAPQHGTLTMGRYGSFTYQPHSDYSGTDQFAYFANDLDGQSAVTVVTLTIEAANDAPVATGDAYSTAEDEVLVVDAAGGVAANDVDVDGDALTFRVVQEPAHGSLTLAEDGSFQYTPDPDFHGEDGFTYVANDGQVDSEVASVTIMVESINDNPVSAGDAYSTFENSVLTVDAESGLLANDTDADGDALTAILVGDPSHGTVTVAEDGSFEYIPDAGFDGEDSFTYVASDGQSQSEETTVAITVEAINDAPVVTEDAYSTTEDTVLVVDAEAGVLANDVDTEGAALTATLVDQPSHGSVVLAADGSFEYTPEADFNGEDVFTYVASDGQTDGAVTTVTITVEAVNDAPIAAADAYQTSEGNVLTVDAEAGVLANDADVEGDVLSAQLVEGPTHGSVVLAADGSFQYTPEAGFSGQDSFSYVSSDGQAESEATSVAITVEAVNDAPVAVGDAYTVAEDNQLNVEAIDGVLANDSDADGDALTVSLVDEPTHGTVTLAEDGSFVYTPEADFYGDDSFTYVAGDGQATSEVTTVAITVEAVNDAPVAAGDAYTVAEDNALEVGAIGGVLANDSDVDGDALTVSLVDEPTHGTVTLAEDGSFVYTPEANFHGDDSFTYVAGDGQATSETTTVVITVESVNDAPTAAADAYETARGSVLTVDAETGVLANDTDIDGDALTAQLVDNPTHGSVVLAADGSFEYIPEPGFSGLDSFTYVSSDGQAESAPTTVSVEVASAQLSIQLQVSSVPFGTEVETLWTDSTFWVSAFVEDLRDLPAGVVGGAFDVLFDALAVTPTGEVVYGDAFNLFQQGDAGSEAGVIDETGALTGTGMVGVGEAAPFVSWQFTRTGEPGSFINGTTQFSVDAGEGTSTILPGNFAMAGSGTGVEWSDVEMGSADINLIFADFNGDQVIDHYDLALWVPHAGAAANDATSGWNPMFDLDSNYVVGQGDLDLLTSAMYTVTPSSEPAAELPGEVIDPAIDTGIDTDLAGLEGESEGEEIDPVLAIDNLFAGEDLWA